MSDALMALPSSPRIGVFRALQLGDLVCAIPALRSLKATRPDAHVTLIGLASSHDFVMQCRGLIDDLLPFPGHASLPEQRVRADQEMSFRKALADEPFDLVIQMHGNGRLTNPILSDYGVCPLAGFVSSEAEVRNPALQLAWPGSGRETSRLLRLMCHLGGAEVTESVCLTVSTRQRNQAMAVLRRLCVDPTRVAIVHAGARYLSRRWPTDRFLAIARSLEARGLQCVFTGSQSELPICASLASAIGHPERSLAGATDLGTLIGLAAIARLVVCNDTGMSHIAALAGTRSVVVASGSDVRRWAPSDVQRHRVLWADVPCRPCEFVICPIGHPCALNVGTEYVRAQCNLQLMEEAT